MCYHTVSFVIESILQLKKTDRLANVIYSHPLGGGVTRGVRQHVKPQTASESNISRNLRVLTLLLLSKKEKSPNSSYSFNVSPFFLCAILLIKFLIFQLWVLKSKIGKTKKRCLICRQRGQNYRLKIHPE